VCSSDLRLMRLHPPMAKTVTIRSRLVRDLAVLIVVLCFGMVQK